MAFQSDPRQGSGPRGARRGNSRAGQRDPKGCAENGVRGAAGSSRRRHVGRGHSGDALSRRAADRSESAARARPGPADPEQGPRERRPLRDLGRSGLHSGRDASDLHEAALDAERASEPQLCPRRRGQHGPARPRTADRRRRRAGRQDRPGRLIASSSSPATANCRRAATGRPRWRPVITSSPT